MEFLNGPPLAKICRFDMFTELVCILVRINICYLNPMNRLYYSIILAAAFFFSITCTSRASDQPSAAMTTQKFEFISNGNRLSGFVDVPASGTARAMIVIVHGYGKT